MRDSSFTVFATDGPILTGTGYPATERHVKRIGRRASERLTTGYIIYRAGGFRGVRLRKIIHMEHTRKGALPVSMGKMRRYKGGIYGFPRVLNGFRGARPIVAI